MAHFLQQQDGNTSFRKLEKTSAYSAQAIAHVRSDTRFGHLLCMVMISSSGMVTTSIGCHRKPNAKEARVGAESQIGTRPRQRSDPAEPLCAIQRLLPELGQQAARPQTSPSGAKPSTPLEQKAYHSVSARLAYLASDRPDVALACKECSRAVGKAARADLARLKRIGRHLLYTPRAVWEFPLQQEESIVLIDGLSDADAAGCPKTRRSTSGGCMRVGQHTLTTWSSTQKWCH